MLKAHTVIAMIATVMLLWGLSLVFRGVGARLPRIRRGRRARQATQTRRPVKVLVTVFGALVGAGSAPVFWTSLQVNRWERSFDPTIEPFTPWTGVAMGMVAFGAALVAWGLRGDRPRGRRRCPGCWYDMAGAPGLLCPECGRQADEEAELLQPRRNHRLVWAGLAIAVLAIGPYYTPRVQRGGWVAAAPTTVLILGLPWWPDEAIAGGARGKDDWSLLGRVEEDAVYGWQLRLLRSRARSLAASANPANARRLALLASRQEDAEMLARASSLLLKRAFDERLDDAERFELLDLAGSSLGQLEWMSQTGSADPAAVVAPQVPALAEMLSDDYFAPGAARVLQFAPDLSGATDQLIAAFRQPFDWELPAERPDIAILRSHRYPGAVALLLAAESDPQAQQALLDAIEGRLSPAHRLAAVLALRQRNVTFPGLNEALAPLIADPETALPATGAFYRRAELAPAAIAQLVAAIEAAPEPDERLVAAATHLAQARVDARVGLERLLDHPSRRVRFAIAVELAKTARAESELDLARLLAVLQELQVTAPADESAGTADRLHTAIIEVEDALRR